MKTILFTYDSPAGTFWIHPEAAGRVRLRIDNQQLRSYSSATDAAAAVFRQSTGWEPWDGLEGVDRPAGLHKWKRGARTSAPRVRRAPEDERFE